jgi:hypothetical protein
MIEPVARTVRSWKRGEYRTLASKNGRVAIPPRAMKLPAAYGE